MANRAKRAAAQDGRAFLLQSFAGVQVQLLDKLRHAESTISHDGTIGTVNEAHWIDVFRSYLPRRYACDSGIVIDSQGQTSDQIDIVIYDPQYTPTLLTQQSHRYIPAEAVYAVFEAKPKIDKPMMKYAAEKAASVRRLHRTSAQVYHVEGVAKPKRPFDLVAGIVATRATWADGLGSSFAKAIMGFDELHRLDCGCTLQHGSFDSFDGQKNCVVRADESVLIYFLFRLLKKLQTLGTVPAINWDTYIEVFGAGGQFKVQQK